MFPLNPRICPYHAQESKGPAAAAASRLLHQPGCSDLHLSHSIQWKQSLSSLHASISRLDDGWLSDAPKGTVFIDSVHRCYRHFLADGSHSSLETTWVTCTESRGAPPWGHEVGKVNRTKNLHPDTEQNSSQQVLQQELVPQEISGLSGWMQSKRGCEMWAGDQKYTGSWVNSAKSPPLSLWSISSNTDLLPGFSRAWLLQPLA